MEEFPIAIRAPPITMGKSPIAIRMSPIVCAHYITVFKKKQAQAEENLTTDGHTAREMHSVQKEKNLTTKDTKDTKKPFMPTHSVCYVQYRPYSILFILHIFL